MKKNLILIIATGFLVTLCNLPEAKEVKFKTEMSSVSDKYKNLLEPEVFQTSTGYFSYDTVTTHKVFVTIYNSKKLPKSDSDLENLAKEIAYDVYNQIINKDDFSVIEVVFHNESGAVVKVTMKRNYPFSFTDIKETIDSINKVSDS